MPLPLLPIIAGGGLLLDWLNGRNRNNNTQGIPAGTPSGQYGKTLLGGGFGGGGGGSSSTSTSNTSYSKNSAPYILPEYAGLMGTLRKQMETRLAGGGLPAGFEENGLRQINDTYRGGEQAVQNQLIGRGLLGSPAEATAFTQQFALPRMGEMSQFRANLPLQQRQMQNEDWGILQQLIDAFGKGTKETGNSSTNTTSTSKSMGGGGGGMGMPIEVGGPAQPGFGQNLLSTIGYLIGSGAFSGGKKSASGSGPGASQTPVTGNGAWV